MAEKARLILKRSLLPSSRPKPLNPKLDRKKLALIHIVKKELKISDSDYRCILKRIAGVDSAKDLDEAKFRKLMYFLVRSKYYQANSFGMTLKQKLFIKFLAKQLRWEESHLNNFIHKYYKVAGLDHLSRKDASKLIESLKAIREQSARE